MTSDSSGDDFFSRPPPDRTADSSVATQHAYAGPVANHRLRRPWAIAGLVLVVVAGSLAVWSQLRGPDRLPLSDPPPDGGSLVAPATLGGAPLSPTGTDASWVGRALPDYDPSDVLFEYYDGRETGHGLISLLAIRGPVDDLPDRTSAAGDPSEWSVTDRVQCGPLYLSSPQTTSQAAVKTDGHVCWRTSGAFSISVLTTDHDLDETISLVNQAWASQ